MLATLDPRRSAGSGSRSAGRRRRRRAPRPRRPGSPSPAGPRARRPASSAATTTASSSGRSGLASDARAARRRGRAARSAATRAYWRFTPGQRRGLGVAVDRAALRGLDRCPPEHGRRRAPRVARAAPGQGARPRRRRRQPCRGQAPPPVARGARRPSSRRRAGSSCVLDEPFYGVAPGPDRRALRGRRGRRLRRHRLLDGRLASRIAAHARGLRLRRTPTTPSPVFLVVVGLVLAWALFKLADRARADSPRSSAAPSAR